jgi:hypothetical protein
MHAQKSIVVGTDTALEIITMIMISIQPFAARKMFALALTMVCLSTASCFA